MQFSDGLPGVYAGGAFNNGLPNGKASGTLRADSDALHFEYEGGKAAFPLSGLMAAFGGAANRLIFFTHPEKPEWTFFTADRRILQDSTLNFSYGLGEQLARLRGSRRMAVAVWLGILGAVVSLIVALVMGIVLNRDALIDSATRQIPPEVEKSLGDGVMEEIKASSKMVEEPEVLAPLMTAADSLLVAPGGQEFKIHIIESQEVNAFALPGGHIVLTTELLLEAESSEEVLGVIGHEMAHAVKRHGMRQMVSTAGLGLLLRAFLGDTGKLQRFLTGVGGGLMKNSYSREQEREADRVGAEYLRKAHIDPRALLEFMRRQQKKLRQSGVDEKLLSYISTHPSFEERIAMLSEKREGVPPEADVDKVNLDYEAFKAKLRETLAKH